MANSVLITVFNRLGVRVNALFFTGFGISAVMGVVFNNTVVPQLGWDAMFIILGCFSVISFIMLIFFTPVKSTFIPYDDERDVHESAVNQGRHGSKADRKSKKRHRRNRSEQDEPSDYNSGNMEDREKELLANSTHDIRKPLLFI